MFYPYGDTKTVVPDIFRRVHLDKYFQNRLHLQEYYISDAESPEIGADKFYGSSKYHWLVIIANNIVDVKREWPLSSNALITSSVSESTLKYSNCIFYPKTKL
mgnify:CR=1 FL=1